MVTKRVQHPLARCFHEVQVHGGHRHGRPVEAAFQQQRAASVAGALETVFEFVFQAVVPPSGDFQVVIARW